RKGGLPRTCSRVDDGLTSAARNPAASSGDTASAKSIAVAIHFGWSSRGVNTPARKAGPAPTAQQQTVARLAFPPIPSDCEGQPISSPPPMAARTPRALERDRRSL